MKPSAASELAVYALMFVGLIAVLAVPAAAATYFSLNGFEFALVLLSVCAGFRAYADKWWPLPDAKRQLVLRMARRSALIVLVLQCIKYFWRSNTM